MEFNTETNELVFGNGRKLIFCKGTQMILVHPLKITIDKEYFREKFEKVIEEFHLTIRWGNVPKKMLLEELMQCFDNDKGV